MCVGQKVEKRDVSSHAIMEICCTAEMTHLGYIEFRFFSPWNSLGINGAALLCTSVYFSILDNPFFFLCHGSSRKEIKYCTGGFHGSDNLFTNMQVRGRRGGPSPLHI